MTRRLSFSFFFLLCLALGANCASQPNTCELGETSYSVGQSFSAGDSCNTCTCGEDGTVSCTKQTCVAFCGGSTKATCKDGQVCVYKVGACQGKSKTVGICKPKRECPALQKPVCGCDDKTYDNACKAEQAGVTIQASKSCPKTPLLPRDCRISQITIKHGETKVIAPECNQTCTCNDGKLSCNKSDCKRSCDFKGNTYPDGKTLSQDGCTEYICESGEIVVKALCCEHEGKRYKENETFKNQQGCTCRCGKKRQVTCGREGCMGCDYKGKHYKDGSIVPTGDGCNTCLCEEGEVSQCTQKPCTIPCGLSTDKACESGLYCAMQLFPGCTTKEHRGQTPGLCKPNADCNDESEDWVCGCDGKNYKNPCLISRAKIRIQAQGKCGNSTSSNCSHANACKNSNEFCKFFASCGHSLSKGQCHSKPTTCPDVYKPVCGCDNKTYKSECHANKAGHGIFSTGPCK